MQTINDRDAWAINGFPVLLGWIVVLIIVAALIWPPLAIPVAVICRAACDRLHHHPAQRGPGRHLLRPLHGHAAPERFPLHDSRSASRSEVPLKLINFVTDHLKVNDRNGNPIEIGAVVVWRVADAAQATFNVDDYKVFVANQSDIAIRTLAAHYPYDSETETSLQGQHRRDRREAAGSRCRPSWRSPASSSRRRGSPISPMRPKSPWRC